MENFPSNSREPQRDPKVVVETPKKILKIVDSPVIRRKKPLGTRVREMFFGDETKAAGKYVWADVLVPAAKDMISDAIVQGLDRVFFGESKSRNRRSSSRSGVFGGENRRVAYNEYSSGSRREDERPSMSRRARASHDFDEIILPTRAKAEEVIDQMFDILSTYDAVSVRDLYELVGENFHHTDEKWGWTDLRGSIVTRTSNGYLLDLPKTKPLE